jgi:7-carboxy-7-deazaguanine synthase
MNNLGRIEDYNKVLPVLELYSSVQSEGSRAGYPTIVIRTTGCTHRCFFGDGGWCDSWYTSIHPQKGTYTFNDIVKIYKENPFIKEMMITGGSPTMHPDLVNELTHFAKENKIFTTIETEGSHFLETDYPIDLLSISPKFSNSIPQIGIETPQGSIVDERMVKQHNKFRLNYEKIAQSINYHRDYHIKPVIDKDLLIIQEVEEFISKLSQELLHSAKYLNAWVEFDQEDIHKIIKSKVWMMPAGATREQLIESYGPVMNFCRDKGYKFSPRPHIIAFDQDRCV